MRTGRCAVRIEGLAHGDRLQLAQDIGDFLVGRGEEQGAADGVLTARQAEYLDYGRQIRNGMAHGQTTHAVMPPAMVVPMVTTSFAIVSELCAAPA